MIRLAAALAIACATLLLPASPTEHGGLFLLALAGSLWLFEALHLTVTALLVPVLAIALGILDVKSALTAFTNPVIAIFFGGFALASALRRHGLDVLLAARLVQLARGQLLPASLLLFAACTLLSMWISNTATVAMLLPLALGLVNDTDPEHDRALRAFVLLGLAWSASIGGMATLVGSPPNALAAAALGLDFSDWLALGLPVALLLWPLGVLVLWLALRPRFAGRAAASATTQFRWRAGAVATLVVFALTVGGWLFSGRVGAWLGVERDADALIALAAAVALLVTRTLNWATLERDTEWGVLLLFGGGICLGSAMQASGADAWLARELLGDVSGLQPLLVLLTITAFVVFLTELVSNTAVTALLLPVLLPLAAELGLAPVTIAAAVALSASCAFMLPVATPPNALVFASGALRQRDMMRAGLRMNMVAIVVIGGWLSFG
ncbi:MAG: Sodium-dependent dicarboxylate transporter SdcS [Pseudomonadales bacterium]|nr:Sodium-dependent dicarboxylate transporter SdcS [Pseudomonadales bacterium]